MELKDWLNSINFTKQDLSEDISTYPPYIVNRCLSGHVDCVLFANEMNKYNFLERLFTRLYLPTFPSKHRTTEKNSNGRSSKSVSHPIRRQYQKATEKLRRIQTNWNRF